MKTALNEEREERIMMEIIVDAYGPEVQAMGWYYYLKDTVEFMFSAVCCKRRSISPLKDHDKVVVVGIVSYRELLEWLHNPFGGPPEIPFVQLLLTGFEQQ